MPSKLPESMDRPSGENARLLTVATCPLNCLISWRTKGPSGRGFLFVSIEVIACESFSTGIAKFRFCPFELPCGYPDDLPCLIEYGGTA